MNKENVQIIVIMGPSGIGKGTIINFLLERCPGKFGFSISHTTRKPRGQEKNGVEYHFTEKEQFEEMIKQGEFVEYAFVHGNYYGTSFKAIHDVL